MVLTDGLVLNNIHELSFPNKKKQEKIENLNIIKGKVYDNIRDNLYYPI